MSAQEKNLNAVVTITGLHHESAAFSNPLLKKEMSETGYGARGGGTVVAADSEAIGNALYFEEAIAAASDNPLQDVEVQAVLDTPEPYPGFTDPGNRPYEFVTFPAAQNPDGSSVQEWEVGEALWNNPEWRKQHEELWTRGGRKVFQDHHIGTMDTGNRRSEEYHNQIKDTSFREVRPHSPFRAEHAINNPTDYKERYHGKKGNQEFLDIQRQAIIDADAVAVPTAHAKKLTENAIAQAGILTLEEIQKKTAVIGIPIDLTDIRAESPLNPKNADKRAEQLQKRATALQKLNSRFQKEIPKKVTRPQEDSFIGDELKPEHTYMVYTGRLDKERGIFQYGMDYADYLEANWSHQENFAHFLIIGGCTNKPGTEEAYAKLLARVRTMKPELQRYFIIPGIPVPHKEVLALTDISAHPSIEEGFGIGSKEDQGYGIFTAVSTHSGPEDNEVSGHLGTNRFGEPGKTDSALGFKTRQPEKVFEAARHLANPGRYREQVAGYREIAKAGYVYAERWGIQAVTMRTAQVIEQIKPGFLQKDGADNIHLGPQTIFTGK